MKFKPELLKKLRTERGLTQEKLAKMVGISPTYISKIEKGGANPSLPVLEELAKVLRVQPSYFFEEPIKKEKPSDILDFIKDKGPDTLTVEEALDLVLRSDHVMFNGKPVGKLDEDVLLDIRDTVVAVLKTLVSKKAGAGVRGVLGSCLVVGAGMG